MNETESEIQLVKIIEYIKRKYPVEVDSEIVPMSNYLNGQIRFRLQHRETRDVMGAVFNQNNIFLSPVEIIKETLERMCEQLVQKDNTLKGLRSELFNKGEII